MMSKVFLFLAVSMAIVALGSAKREREHRNNNEGACTTNDECEGSKVCDIEKSRCVKVKCIEDADCKTGRALLYRNAHLDRQTDEMTGQFCFLSKCKDILPLKATCIKDSWCTSKMCKNGVCAESPNSGISPNSGSSPNKFATARG